MTAANEANFLSVWRLFASTSLPGVEAHDGADSTWFLTGLPHPMMNAVLRADLADERRNEAIDSLLAPFQARRVPMLWYVWPSPSSHEIEAALPAHGLSREGNMPAMAMDLSALPAKTPPWPGVTIETVETHEALSVYIDTLIAGFEMPDNLGPIWLQLFTLLGVDPHAPLRHYLARLDGKPVATTALVLAAGVAGIYNVATVPQARRRGIGSVLTLHALHDARNAGYRVGVLQSSSMGHPIYEAMGFRDTAAVAEFLWIPEAAEPRG